MTLAIAEPVAKPVSDASTFDCGGARVRAHCRHLATVVTVRGEIDGLNVDRIGDYIQRFVVEQTNLVLDMSGVTHFAPVGISLLHDLDEDCRAVGVEWTLVANPAVIDLLETTCFRLRDRYTRPCATWPTLSSADVSWCCR